MRQIRFSNYRPSPALQQAIAEWYAALADSDQPRDAMKNGRNLRSGQSGARREEDSGLRRTRNSRSEGGEYAAAKRAEWDGGKDHD